MLLTLEYRVLRNYLIGLTLLLVTLFVLACMSGCAQLGGGPTNTVISQVVPNSLDINATVLLDNATVTCNAAAADQYNANMNICSNVGAYISSLPAIGFGVTPAQEQGVVTLACVSGGYTVAGLPTTIAPGPPNVCSATPAGKAAAAKFSR